MRLCASHCSPARACSSSNAPTTRSCWCLPSRRRRRSPTSARPSATRCASRCRARRSPASCHEEDGRRSSPMCRRCRCRALRSMPGARRSEQPCRSCETSAFPTSGRRSSSPPASARRPRPPRARPAVRAGIRACVLRQRASSTTSRIPTSSSSGRTKAVPLRIARELVDADVVVCVSAAETVVHGGPASCSPSGGPEALRACRGAVAARAQRLARLASRRSPWRTRSRGESPLLGVSLALDQPRIAETAFGYPYDPRAAERIAARGWRSLFRLLPGPSGSASSGRYRVRSPPRQRSPDRRRSRTPRRCCARSTCASIELDAPLDAICLGIPRTTPYLPRERPNPLLAAYLGLGLALRLWRERPPVVDGGTAILAPPLPPPLRTSRRSSRTARSSTRPAAGSIRRPIDEAEEPPRPTRVRLDAIAAGRACHPLSPFADWAAIQQQTERLGAVIVGGCRDAAARASSASSPHRAPAQRMELALGGGWRRRDRLPALAALLPDPRRQARGSSRGTASSARAAAR